MKKLLLCSFTLACAMSLSAQIYTQDFEGTSGGALPSGWTQVTAATDGGFQSSTSFTSTYFDFAAHTTYVGTNDDICNCDKANEELISDAIAIPATGVHNLSFEYVLGLYYGETGEVGISTDGGATNTQLALLDPTRVGSTSEHTWESSSFSLAAYAGQTINIVWTYHDNADWGSGMMIDDVAITALAGVDMAMTAITNSPTIVAGSESITGTVTNNGANNITSIDISWNDGTGPYNETFTVNLNYGDTYNFTHGTALTAVAGTNYTIDVTVVAGGDADASNDVLSTTLSTVSALVPKVTIGEEKTGEWCGFCPRGAVALAEMAISNSTDFIGIAVHNADPMTIAAYDNGTATLPTFTGFPHGGVDRVVDGDPSSFSTMHATRASEIPPASVSVVATSTGSTITATVTANFVGAMNGDYRLACVLLEDNVSGTQSNYYDGGGYGPLAMPNGGSMPNFDFVTGGATVNPMSHDHVARALGNNEYFGAAGSLPSTISAGDSESHVYTFTQNASWKLGDMHAVGILVNGTTGEALNAGKSVITEFVGIEENNATNFSINAYPNPTSGRSIIAVDMKEAGIFSIVVINVLGEIVHTHTSPELGANSYVTPIDLSNNASGIYYAKVSLNGEVQNVKINLTK